MPLSLWSLAWPPAPGGRVTVFSRSLPVIGLWLCLASCASPGLTLGPAPHEGASSFNVPPPPPATSATSVASATPSASAPPEVSPPLPVSSAPAAPEPTPDAALGRAARVLAGLSTEATRPEQRERLEQHARASTTSFDAFEEHAGKGMLTWSKEHLLAHEGTVFYPFAGPDLVTAHRFYPRASRYVLVALQDGGEPPDMGDLSVADLDHTLDIYERIFDAFARRGFFITAHMGAGYRTPRAARGICGVLMAFAEREGLRVVAAEPVRIRSDGNGVENHPGDRRAAETWASLRLHLRREDGSRVTVEYIKLDLSDPSLRHDAGALGYLRQAARGPTLLKAASHLPQQPAFTAIRDVILEGTPQLVQDETGVAYRLLEDPFKVKLFGSFKSVNGLFDGRPQQALKRAYERSGDVAPLPFAIGYRKAAGSALMVATRRSPSG